MVKNIYKICNKKALSLHLSFVFFCLVFVAIPIPDTVSAITSDIAKWYSSDEKLDDGQIVSIQTDKGDYVSSAVIGKSTKLLGVVVPKDEALVSIDEFENGTQVAIAGRAQAKVDATNGPISRGDYIGVSKNSGFGSKATQGQPVVGIAESSFGSSGEGQSSKSGIISIIVSVGVAPSTVGDTSTSSTTWLRSVAGRDVSALQLAFVFFIAAVGIIAIIVLSYSAIRSGVVAVGRNPLAKPAILRSLSQAMIMVSLVAISCFSLMYFMLRL